ncbi:MAG: hypothetical protein IPJ85_04050 [Flavobacteriales bacterium]|nr:hypothetical protein [Flavobacteriales bacterium]
MRFQHRLMLAACALAATLSCRKDKDSEPPRVRILAPGAGFSVSVPDTFMVSVAVSDDHLVKSLTVLIADANGVPITAPIVESVNARSKEFALDLPILDERVVSGQFQIIAMANDGTNTSRDFVAITVNAAPLRIRSTFLIPVSSAVPTSTIWRIDSTGAMSGFVELTDLSGALVDADYLFTAGSSAGPLQRWPLNGGGGSELMANTTASNDYFRGLSKDPTDNRIYVCTADGQVRGFNRNGVPTFSGFAPPGFVGESLVVVGDFVLCSALNPATQQRVLVKHAYQSGDRVVEFNAFAAPVAMYARDSQHVLLFGNSSAGGHILDVNVELGGAFEMRNFLLNQSVVSSDSDPSSTC